MAGEEDHQDNTKSTNNIDLESNFPLLNKSTVSSSELKNDVNIESAGIPSKNRLICIMMIMTLVFFFTYIGYFALESMQSSINVEGGLGATAVALVTFLIGIFSAPAGAIVQKITPKWTICAGTLGCLVFVCVNYYPNYVSLYIWSIWV
jgi:hypothetical protein